MDLKTAFSKVKKSVELGDPMLPVFVALETIANTPLLSRYIPSRLRKFVNEKLEKKFNVDGKYFIFYGYKFYVPDYSAWVILNENCENEIFSILRSRINNNTIFVDIGAHVGKYTIPLANLCKKVIAIEADPTNAEYLIKNVELNKISNVKIFNCACYSSNGYVYFDTNKSSNVKKIVDYGKSKVRAMTLDDIFNSIELDKQNINIVIKIDVEGAEYDVLLGARNIIEKYKPTIICECWENNWSKIINFFSKYNYTYNIVSPKSNIKVKDVLFYPKL